MPVTNMSAMTRSLCPSNLENIFDKEQQNGLDDIHANPGQKINDRAKHKRAVLKAAFKAGMIFGFSWSA